NPAISNFFRKGRPIYCRKGDVIAGMDPAPQGVYFIETGYVKAYAITDQGDEFLHIIYGSGEIFPFVWAYFGISPDLYYEALSEALLWRVSRQHFSAYVKNNPKGGYDLASQL